VVMVEVMIRFLVVQSSRRRTGETMSSLSPAASAAFDACSPRATTELPVQRHGERRFCAEGLEGVGDGSLRRARRKAAD